MKIIKLKKEEEEQELYADGILTGNLIFTGGKVGIDAKTGKLSGFEPCLLCTKMIINAGLERIVIQKSEESFITVSLDDMKKRFEDKFKK